MEADTIPMNRFALGREVVPFFAVAGPMWEILLDGRRLLIMSGNREAAQLVADKLNEATHEH